MLGKIVADRYRLDKRLGQGGFGTVYLCTDLKLKRQVALKLLELSGADDLARRLSDREPEYLAALDHPRIVAVHDSGEWEGRPYLVMQYVPGPSLADVMPQGSVTLSDVYRWALGICDGMAYAHRQGFVHRDLTLRNIMLDQGVDAPSQIKILDFGLAKYTGNTVATTRCGFIGTPSYMSPEQAVGGSVDARSDIFSFGVCLFGLACGRLPFVAEHPMAVMYQIQNKNDLDFPEGLPRELVDIICACLEKDPERRPPSFEVVAARLASLATDAPYTPASFEAGGDTVTVWPTRSSRRNPYLNRVMIKDPREFFGREPEIQKVFARLDAAHPQSISIVGERRIGKSSLLNFIYNRSNRRRHMTQCNDTLFMYLDFQQDTEFTITKFVDFVFAAIDFEMGGAYSCVNRPRDLAQMKAVFQELMGLGKRIVILMDEFEVITNNPNFDSDFFSFLRAMANSYKVAYVTSSGQELQRLCHNQDISDSPFFNIFSNLSLRPFTRDEALLLISTPARREGVELAPHAEAIIELAGGHPMMLQIACACAFENLIARPDGDLDWTGMKAAFREEVDPHYQAAWDHLDPAGRDCLETLARGKSIGKKLVFAREQLVRGGMLISDETGARFAAGAFRDFVVEAVGAHGGREGWARRVGELWRQPRTR
jgi:serine/threonine protein kinase